MYELVILSLGSNLGDREENLAAAITLLGTFNRVKNIKSASFYESEPLYNTNQPNFLNTIISCDSSLNPFDFLDKIKHIEFTLGRPKERDKNQPRIIDIDIILFGNTTVNNKKLVIPHPRYSQRDFVLIPLLEINNKLKDPQSGQLISLFLDSIQKNKMIEKLDF